MKTKQIELYEYDELSEDAKVKALSNFVEGNDYYFLEDDLNEYLKVLLEENNIKGDAKVSYNLSYSQGDNAFFMGDVEYKGVNFSINHEGFIDYDNDEDDEGDALKSDVIDAIYQDFKQIYEDINHLLKKSGYEFIEYQDGEENFKEMCDANEYTFRASGEMENL